jgi:hypothetical protein
MRFDRDLELLPGQRAGIAGTATIVVGRVARRERVAERAADPLPRARRRARRRAEHDEEQQLVVLLEVDDEAVEHLVDLLHDRVDLARARAARRRG